MWRVVLCYLVGRLDPSAQELGGVAKRGAHVHLSLRDLLRLQGRRLPKRLVVRVSGKGEHLLDGTLDHHGMLLAYGHRAFSFPPGLLSPHPAMMPSNQARHIGRGAKRGTSNAPSVNLAGYTEEEMG